MVWSEIVWFQIMNLMVWGGSGVGQSADGCDISSEIAFRLTSWDLSDDKSTLVQVMAWCHTATSHYLNQCWPRPLPSYSITRRQRVKCQPVLNRGLLMLLILPPLYLYPLLQQSWKGGILVSLVRLSVRPSVRLSVCGQNRVRSVSSTILIGSISYLHILSSNFRRCVACNARFKIKKYEILANF